MPNALPYPVHAAYENPIGHVPGAVADVDLSASQFLLARYTSTGTVEVNTTAGTKCIGVINDKPKAGDAVNIMNIGESKVIAGAAVAVGDLLQNDGSGRAITRTGTNEIVGVAMQAASGVGVRIAMKLSV